jgi:hypothetical protein
MMSTAIMFKVVSRWNCCHIQPSAIKNKLRKSVLWIL